jgi:8-oxo-dGTP diphosphatase
MDITKNYIKATLCLPIDGDKVLLAQKTRKIGVGKFNGTGGELEPGETLRECVVRESLKELGITIDQRNMEHVAIIDFFNRRMNGTVFRARVWVYIARGWKGMFRAGEEMINPTLFPLGNLPFDSMMSADRCWIPEVLFEKRKIRAKFHYSPNQEDLEGEPIIEDLPADMLDL